MGGDERLEELKRLLLESDDPLASFDRSALAGDPEARAELARMHALVQLLEGFGDEEREALRELRARPPELQVRTADPLRMAWRIGLLVLGLVLGGLVAWTLIAS